MKYFFALVFVLFSLGSVSAKEAAYLAQDPVVEKRLIAISEEMR